MSLRIKINEQSAKLKEYRLLAFGIEDDIVNHASYILLYNDSDNENHWKQELYGFCSRLKGISLKSGDKEKVTSTILVEISHGVGFCEEIETPSDFFRDVYDSEEIPHPFDYSMDNEKNVAVFFEALNKFYGEFLVPWIASEKGSKQDLYDAVDKYLVSARSKYI